MGRVPIRPWVLAALVLLLAGGGCGRAPDVDLAEVRRRVERLDQVLERLHAESWRRQWDAFGQVGGSRGAISGAMLPCYEHQALATWRGHVAEPELARRVELLYRLTLGSQLACDGETNELVAAVLSAQSSTGDEMAPPDFELSESCRRDPDRARREASWRALKMRGVSSAVPLLAQLMARRNAIARSLGFDDFYGLYLASEDLDAVEVDRLLTGVDRSAEPAAAAVRDAALRLGVEALRPWDVEFALRDFLAQLEPSLPADALPARLRATLSEMGLDLNERRIAVRWLAADARQRAYLAFPVDPPRDVRLVVTAGSGFYPYRAALHEAGHAVYYSAATADRFSERLPPNGAWSEGFAKLFERLPYQPAWLRRYAGLQAESAATVTAYGAADELSRVRFFLGELRFEREAYRDPSQDLARLYRATMERTTGLSWEGVESSWASVPHYASQPFSGLEYLLARLIQAQVYRELSTRFGSIVGNPAVGKALEQELAAPGSTRPWRALVRSATRKDLDASAYLEDELDLR